MKRLTLLLATAIICLTLSAQDERGKTDRKKDTIRIGGMVIVKQGKNKNGNGQVKDVSVGRHHVPEKNKNVSTNWGVLDLGFSNYDDNTNYSNTGSYLINKPGSPSLGKNDFRLRTEKSINVNIWVFMQRVNLVKHYVNLKYGLGIESNNYRYTIYDNIPSISYKEGGYIPYTPGTQTTSPFIFRDSIAFSKNKLVTNYLTVPLMLNFTTNPFKNKKAFNLSLGISAGYLYNQHNKQVSNERGKWKNNGDYDLERFKFSYVAEIGLGPVRFYGSYSPSSMYKRGLDIKPYTVGLRFSNW